MDRIEKLLQEMIEAQNSITFLAGKGEFGKAAKVIDQRTCLWNQIADDLAVRCNSNGAARFQFLDRDVPARFAA